jgi:putative nucleotidyltransferase with HDIG domain
MEKTLRELISGTHELASLPTTTAKLLELLDDPCIAADRLLDVIGSDPSLTANLLKLCNSAYYGRKRQIGSVKEALVLLGNKTVVTLAFATSMGKVMRGELAGYGLEKEDLWRHALAVSFGAAAIVGEKGQMALRERAYTAGLVHDVGKLVLDRLLVERLEWTPVSEAETDYRQIEREIIGWDHAEAGAALAQSWNFPEVLVSAIRWHHEPNAASEHGDVAAAVHAADAISSVLGVGGGALTALRMGPLEDLERVGVPMDVVRNVAASMSERLDDLLEAVAGMR